MSSRPLVGLALGLSSPPVSLAAPIFTTIEVANTDTTISRSAAGVIAVEGVAQVSVSGTQTLTNKRITRRVVALTDAATVTPNADTTDEGKLTELSQATEIANPTGTPTDGQFLEIRIKSTTSRALTYGAQFRGSTDLALPSATTGTSLTDRMLFEWNAADSKWDIIAKVFGF